MVHLVPLSERPDSWDRDIERFATKTLFHESAWLDFIDRTRGAVEYFRLESHRGCLGYFCAVRAKRLNSLMWGSPFPGAGLQQGPVVDGDADQRAVVQALLGHCLQRGIAHLAISNDWLTPGVMQELGFSMREGANFVCPLDGGSEAVWSRMRGTCRTRIRKAEKSGLRPEVTTDPDIVSSFYEMFVRVLRSKAIAVPYGREVPQALFDHLGRAGRLFAVRIFRDRQVVAAGFYPHDDRCMYYWDAAYDPDYVQLSPNELLHWTAMRAAILRGVPLFNIGGFPRPSRFSEKFGGALVPHRTYERSFQPLFAAARGLYHLVTGHSVG